VLRSTPLLTQDDVMSGTPHTLVQVPSGAQCFVGDEARRRRAIEAKVLSVFEGWDYEEIIPPLVDYADVFAGGTLASKTYSFLGRDGSLLALRPDFTSLVAKIAAGRLLDRPAPLRLYYSGEVLRYEQPRAGAQSELFQMGLEHLGGAGRAADAEVLTVAAECLDAVGARGFVLALGHVGVFGGLAAAAGLGASDVEALRERVSRRDTDGVTEGLRHGAPVPIREALVRLTTLGAGPEALEEAAAAFACCPPAARAVSELVEVVSALVAAGLGSRLALDLGEVRGLDYYTGMVFRVYAPDLGFEVGAGGRYDALLARFGRPLPAVGFMLGLDRLERLLDRQGRVAVAAAPAADPVSAESLGATLARARERRAQGARVRLDAP
jgi:ATP phosphoribosyltransferase regulatory subunit